MDLFTVGPDEQGERLAGFAAVLGLARHGERSLFSKIRVVYPAAAIDGNIDERIRSQFGAVLTELDPTISAADAANMLVLVEVVRPASLEVEALVRLAWTSPPNTALIIGRAALYRDLELQPLRKDGEQSYEEVWTPHLHSLLERLREPTEATQSYTVADAGEHYPIREHLRELLHSVNHASIVVADNPVLDERRRTAERLAQLAAAGDIQTALKELNEQVALEPLQKSLIRLQLFEAANLPEAIRPEIESHLGLYRDLPPDLATRVAVYAEKAGFDGLSAELLRAALTRLERREYLEEALRLARRLDEGALVRAAEERLHTTFPNSGVLRSHLADRLAAKGQFRNAAELIGADPAFRRIAEYWERLDAADFSSVAACHELLTEVEKLFPEFADDAVGVCSQRLVDIERPSEALELIFTRSGPGPLGHARANAAMGVVRETVLRSGSVEDDLLLAALTAAVGTLASQPSNASLRGTLSRLVSAESAGLKGIVALVLLLLDLFGDWDLTADRGAGLDPPPPLPDETAIQGLIVRGFEWLSSRVARVGSETYPEERLTVPPEQALRVLSFLVNTEATNLSDPNERSALDGYLSLAIAIAPLGPTPALDLEIASQASIRLAHGGHVQYARDWAEQILALAGSARERARIAWLNYADVYSRTGNLVEALIGLNCAFATGPAETWAGVWDDSIQSFRVLRDLGWPDAARRVLSAARVAHQHVGSPLMESRLSTAELQLDVVTLSGSDRLGREKLAELLERAATNYRKVVELGDEVGPSAILLAAVIRYAGETGAPVPADVVDLASSTLSKVDITTAALIETELAPTPSIDQVLAIAKQLQPARYPEDAGYDVQRLALAATRLLGTPAAAADPITAAYAIEALADHSVASWQSGVERVGLLLTKDGPAVAASRLSVPEIPILLMGIANGLLVRIDVVAGQWNGPVIEAGTTFDLDRLRKWKVLYPYAYGVSSDDQHFYTSTDGLGVSALPERAVVITTAQLQPFPLNLLRVGDDLAGWAHRLCAVPSLAWLESIRKTPFHGTGRRLAWIPHDPRQNLETLAVLAARLEETLQRFGVELSAATEAPDDTAGSEIVVVAAHGGVVESNRFFRAVKDDNADLALSPAMLSKRLANCGACRAVRLLRRPLRPAPGS